MTPEADAITMTAGAEIEAGQAVTETSPGVVEPTIPSPPAPPPGNSGTETVPPENILNTVNNGSGDGGDGVALNSISAPPPDVDHDFDEVEDAPQDGPGEGVYAPSVAIIELERDGVLVRRTFNHSNGQGIEAAFVELKEKLDLARTGQPVPLPDPNLAARERASATGHDLSDGAHACRKCGIAEWACLEGQPCNPREFDAGGEPEAENIPATG